MRDGTREPDGLGSPVRASARPRAAPSRSATDDPDPDGAHARMRVRRGAVAFALVGLALLTAAVLWLGAGRIWHAISTAGWAGFGVLLAWQLVLSVVLGAAWRVVCPGASLAATIWGRLVREGATNALPLSEVGGLVFGARALVLTGVPWARAASSSAVDIAAEAIAEVPFVAFGVLALLWRRPGSTLVWPLIAGLCLAIAACVTLLVLARTGALRRVASRLARGHFPNIADDIEALGDDADRIFGQPGRVAAAASLHLVAWFGGGVSVLIAYRAIGQPIGVIDAMAIEAMLSGALGIAFLIPAGLGVQELSYVGIGALFGMPPNASLALSLLRRARDLVLGLPAVLGWQALEARRLARPGATPLDPAEGPRPLDPLRRG